MTNASNSKDQLRPLDLVHLARHTLGDRDLETEVLRLFATQSRTLLARLESLEGEERQRVAHTLKGSARAIGAWEVAKAAEDLEADPTSEAKALAQAIARANDMIVQLAA
jgi:HPt (histidine-containing phosphotransfer) domain-containing protein